VFLRFGTATVRPGRSSMILADQRASCCPPLITIILYLTPVPIETASTDIRNTIGGPHSPATTAAPSSRGRHRDPYPSTTDEIVSANGDCAENSVHDWTSRSTAPASPSLPERETMRRSHIQDSCRQLRRRDGLIVAGMVTLNE